jgi:hypothetical protein
MSLYGYSHRSCQEPSSAGVSRRDPDGAVIACPRIQTVSVAAGAGGVLNPCTSVSPATGTVRDDNEGASSGPGRDD